MAKFAGALVLCIGVLATLAPTSVGVAPAGNIPILSTVGGTFTNCQPVAYTNGTSGQSVMPNALYPSSLITNIVAVDISRGKYVAIQITAQSLNANAGSNITWWVGRSVAPVAMSTNNAVGINSAANTPAIEWFATITNSLSNTALQPSTVTAMYGDTGGTAAQGGAASVVIGSAGYTTLYLGLIQVPALVVVTNCSVYVNVN